MRPTPGAYTAGNDLPLERMVNAVAHCGQRAELPQMAVGSENLVGVPAQENVRRSAPPGEALNARSVDRY